MNNNEEKFGVVLTAIVDGFKKEINKTISFTKNAGKEIENNLKINPVSGVSAATLKSINDINSRGLFGNKKVVPVNASKELNDIAKNGEKIENVSLSFDKATSKVKKFTLGLMGARSVFGLLMQYQSAYYKYNEQLQYQNELARDTIALSLAPVFEAFGTVLQYVAVAIGVVAEKLFGINVFSKLTTGSINNLNKSLKSSKTLLSGIDEITNLGNNDVGTGFASQFAGLEKYKEIIDDVKENWDKYKYLFGAVAGAAAIIKIGTTISGLASVLGTSASALGFGTGLAGLAGLLGYIAGFAALVISIKIIVDSYKEITGAVNELKALQDMREESFEGIRFYASRAIRYINESYLEMLNLDKESDEYKDKLMRVKEMWTNISSAIADGALEYEDHKDEIDDVISKLNEMTGENYEVKLELALDTAKANKQSESFLSRLWNGVAKVFGKNTTKTSGGAGTGFAKGLDYVPYDEFPAVLHKGEAVVPAKYNPTIHSQGNEYTNNLLETLVEKMDNMSSRPNVFEIDGRQFASATYSLYKNEQNRQNYNSKVSVRNG